MAANSNDSNSNDAAAPRDPDPEMDLIMNASLARNEYPAAEIAAILQRPRPSLAARFCTREVWDLLKDKVSSGPGRWTLARAINTAVQNPTSLVGCHVGDAESFDDFAPFFMPVIKAYHTGFDPATMRHVSDFDPAGISGTLNDAAKAKVISTRIRVGRNLAGLPLNTAGTRESRLAVAAILEQALGTLRGTPYEGEFLRFETLSEARRQQLIDDHILFKGRDRMQAASGYHAFWPAGRAVFLSKDGAKSICWISEGDHLRVVRLEQGADILGVFRSFVEFQCLVEAGVRQATGRQQAFSFHPVLGFVCCCPSNIGSALRASTQLCVPRLLAKLGKDAVEGLATKLHCQVRGAAGEHSDAGAGGRVEVSNRRRLGVPETELISDLIRGVNLLAQMEADLDAADAAAEKSSL